MSFIVLQCPTMDLTIPKFRNISICVRIIFTLGTLLLVLGTQIWYLHVGTKFIYKVHSFQTCAVVEKK